jgi:hypothetical protein
MTPHHVTTKDLIRQFTAALENAPDEASLGLSLAKQRRAMPPLQKEERKAGERNPGFYTVVCFHKLRRADIADSLARAGATKITFRSGTFTLTVWNTKETLQHLITKAKRK